ncbi:MAG TPA: hypothetical protein VGN09_14625 [Vicinamibacteria bacterium]
MSAVNALLRAAFDVLLSPFRSLPPIVGLLLVSLVAAVGMLLVFKATSNQKKLEAVKRQIHACLFEIRLFNSDLPAIVRAQWEILRHNLNYLRLSAVPMLWMIVPFVFVIAQLQFHYGYRGLAPGQDFLLKVQLKDGWETSAALAPSQVSTRPAASLQAPPGLKVETPAVWIPSQRELAWRLRAEQWGDYDLALGLGGQQYSKTVQVSRDVRRRSPVRVERGFWNELLYPAEDPLPPGSPISAITLGYPDGSVPVFGWGINWLVLFFVLSAAFAFALRGRFGVTL